MQETACDRHIVARNPVKLSEAAFGFPRFFENHRRPMSTATVTVGSAFDENTDHSLASRCAGQFNCHVSAARQIAMKQTFGGSAFLGACAMPNDFVLHDASCALR
jgi:hypothetical protein